MDIDLGIACAGLIVGFVVGLTGMGGGALMTPLLVLVFKVQPLAAVSSDLVASFVMKPIGAGVHLRRGTVNLQLVKWLVIGSVPTAPPTRVTLVPTSAIWFVPPSSIWANGPRC